MSAPAGQDGRIRVVHCIGSLRLGGAEKQLAELICRLPRERFEQRLVTIQSQAHPSLAERIRAAGCEILSLDYRQNRRSWDPRFYASMLGAAARYAGALRAFGPNVVHAQLDWANILSMAAGRMAGAPVVVTSRLSLSRALASRAARQRLENFANRRATAIFINSEAVRRDVIEREGLPAEKLHLIYNGVILEDFSGRSRAELRARLGPELGVGPEDLVAIAVANLHPYKGHEELIRAAASLAGVFPRLRLLLPGRDAGSRAGLESLIASLGAGGAVRLLGERKDVPELLAMSDLFVHPSHEEGFSNAILEAMATGLPCVATRVGGNPEAVREGEEGLLAPPKDWPALAAALRRLAADAGLRAAMGARARARAESAFSMPRMIAEFAAWYESLAAAGRKGDRA